MDLPTAAQMPKTTAASDLLFGAYELGNERCSVPIPESGQGNAFNIPRKYIPAAKSGN